MDWKGIACIIDPYGYMDLCFDSFNYTGPYSCSILCVANKTKAEKYLETLQTLLPLTFSFREKKISRGTISKWMEDELCGELDFTRKEFNVVDLVFDLKLKPELLLVGNLAKVISEYPQLIDNMSEYSAETVVEDLVRTFKELEIDINSVDYCTDHFPIGTLVNQTKFPKLSDFLSVVKKQKADYVWPPSWKDDCSSFEQACE